MTNRNFWIAFSSLAVAIAILNPIQAQDEQESSAFSVSGGVQTTSHYFYNGWNQEDQGLIIQADIGVGVDLSDIAPGLSLNFGLWNSFHEQQTGATGPNAQWYEADLSMGVGYEVPNTEGLNVGATYVALTSPNGAFATVHELQFGISHPVFGINPYATLGIEMQNTASLGGGDASEGTYMILGVEPKFDLPVSEELPMRILIPVSTGFGFGNYYEGPGSGSQFGFFSVGTQLEIDLDAFIKERYGKWTTFVGAEWLMLGDGPRSANKRDRNDLILTVGIRLAE